MTALGRDEKPPAWHALPAQEVAAALESDATAGLSIEEVGARTRQFGANELPEPKRRSLLMVFLLQFKSPLIYLLLLAAVVAAAIGEKSDPFVILVVVLLNACIGAFQEGRAEKSLQALRRLATHTARLIRGNQEILVQARDIVPGDILLLAAGDAVPADARLLDGAALRLAEAALTGESLPISKDASPLAAETRLADRRNMVYAGTHVTAGRARSIVVATGLATEIGHIATLAESGKEPRTPLERRIDQFGRYVVIAAVAIFAGIIGIGLVRSLPMGEVVMVGISQLVGMIPEGLPVAMTIALAIGVQRMARRRAVIRRLTAVETLGSTSVICTDKTGTLTANEMTVTAIYLPGGRHLDVTGTGYSPEGRFLEGGRPAEPKSLPALLALLETGVLCSDAQLVRSEEGGARWKPIGDPTEVALLTLAVKGGLAPGDLRTRNPRRRELPFDSAHKMMATQHDGPSGPRVLIKGAPEEVLDLCAAIRLEGQDLPLDQSHRVEVRSAAQAMAEQALRVLALAVIEGSELAEAAGFPGLRGRATLLGLVGQIDPPRPEVREAVAQCRLAGIRPVMVTGDHKATGLAIARSLGIARGGGEAIDGRELEQLSDQELAARISSISVFARVHPAQKVRIVEAYQQSGEVVAMTGDGVNDAPALVRADVGVAMGLTGTDVAKEAAKIVVTDDNFATIVAAVEEGRVVYRNIKKAILLLFTTSLAEVLVLVAALLLGYPPPFAAAQILWNNLVTEGLITINLIMEPAEGDEMRRPPVNRGEPLLSRPLLARMAFMTPAIVVSTLGWFTWRLSSGVPMATAQTETFTLLAVCEWFNVLNCRSERRSAFTLSLFKNPWLLGGLLLGNLLQVAVIFLPALNPVFHTVPISLEQALAIGAAGSLVLWVEELRKLIARRRDRARTAPAGAPATEAAE